MTWISKSITAVGLVLLAHACYSAHEHSALQALRAADSPVVTSSPPLPLDISIETTVALVLSCMGIVLGTPQLRPVQWRVWAGKIEREGAAGFTDASGAVERDYVGNPFRVLETRPGFVDIRRLRSEFAGWVKSGGK